MKKTVPSLILSLFALVTGCVDPSLDDEALLDETQSEITADARLEIKSMINTSGVGMCLDIAGGGNAIGTPIVQFPCHRALNQQWKVTNASLTTFQIVSIADPTRCVGFAGTSTATDGTLLRLAACTDATGLKPIATQWDLVGSDLLAERVSHASFRSAMTPGNRCIDVASGSSALSLWMQLYRCHGGLNQRWELRNW